MKTKIYNAVLMTVNGEMTGQFKMPMNPRFLVVIGEEAATVLGADTAPNIDDIPVGAHVFHRVGSAVWIDDEASTMYEYLGEKP